jgi:hypothetical protein
MKKEGIIILALAFLLVLTLSYLAFSEYNKWKQNRELEIYQQGAQYGYEQAVMQVVQQAVTCQAVPLRVGNETISIVAIDCLTQATGGENETL